MMFLKEGRGATRKALLLASGAELYCLYFVLDNILGWRGHCAEKFLCLFLGRGYCLFWDGLFCQEKWNGEQGGC